MVTPLSIHELSGPRKLALAAEILVTYGRVRWAIRGEDATTAVPRIRAELASRSSELDAKRQRIAGLRLGHAVIRTLTPLPADSRCLFRSLVLTKLLARRGIDGTVVLAVRPEPFAAHAWVELDGNPLLPPGEDGYERLVEL
jgi:hypothetical protein